jgi:hypothetical protein
VNEIYFLKSTSGTDYLRYPIVASFIGVLKFIGVFILNETTGTAKVRVLCELNKSLRPAVSTRVEAPDLRVFGW